VSEVKFHYQERPNTCGTACLRMLLSPYHEFDEQTLTNYTDTTLFGTPRIYFCAPGRPNMPGCCMCEAKKMNRQKAEELASRYLTANIGEKVGPGLAYFDSKANGWIVPILYQAHFTQPPQRVGELHVDATTQAIRAPSLAELTATLEPPRASGLTIILHFDHSRLIPPCDEGAWGTSRTG